MSIKRLMMSASLILVLGACQTTQTSQSPFDYKKNSIDNALKQAIQKSQGDGAQAQSLVLMERLYKRNPQDPAIALEYVSALEQTGYLEQATFVLGSLAKDEKAEEALRVKYNKLLLKTGQFKEAENISRSIVELNNENFEALHFLGIALDAQGYHEQAEKAFRRALNIWQGDPTPILNNLALNLTSQGFFDEATSLMEQAKSLNPESDVITNNALVLKDVK